MPTPDDIRRFVRRNPQYFTSGPDYDRGMCDDADRALRMAELEQQPDAQQFGVGTQESDYWFGRMVYVAENQGQLRPLPEVTHDQFREHARRWVRDHPA